MNYVSDLEKYRSDFMHHLNTLLTLESPTQNKQLNDKLADYLAELFSEVGKVTRIKKESVGDNIKVEYGEGEKQVLILCHMDTVWDEGEVLKRPMTVKDGKIYGPGIYDMKYSIVQAYFALKTLKEHGIDLNYRIVVYINSDEETGSIHSCESITEEALKSKCALVMEPSEDNGFVKTRRKGMSEYKLIVKGKAAHAGAFHQDGISAVKELAHQVINIEKLTNYEQGITANTGVIKGGTRTNVIPDYAEADIDIRYKTVEQADFIDRYFSNLKSFIDGTELEAKLLFKKLPFDKNEGNTRLYQTIQQVAQKMGLPMGEIHAGGLSDGNTVSALGVPTIDGLGAVGMNSHSIDEYVSEEKLMERVCFLVNILIELNDFNANP